MIRWRLLCGLATGVLFVTQMVHAAENDGEGSELRTILLSDFVTTSSQKELQSVHDVLQKSHSQTANDYLRQILAARNGSSNAFLVDAANIGDALKASSSILVGSRSTDTPATANTSQPNRGTYWLIAYLGTGPSDPPWWTIHSLSVGKGKIILRYRKSVPRPATEDEHRYYYWVPLGKLDPGAYEIQLFDAAKPAVTLMRRVEVP